MLTKDRIYEGLRKRVMIPYSESRDFRTDRHIIVFESDDWGSIRMSNKKDWDELLKIGYPVNKRPYERFDTLESSEDLLALFEVLSKHYDSRGNHPVITANMLMANPDFEKIKNSGYRDYSYEPISDTYLRYYGNTDVLELMREGYEKGLFMPQSHGREHFNVGKWMQGLRTGDEDMMTAFYFSMCGIAPKGHPEKGNKLMNALHAGNEREQARIDAIVADGLDKFEQLWGFKSKTFVAPCYLWCSNTEKVLFDKGVQLIQTSRIGKPAFRTRKRYFYTGKCNKYSQLYSVRNCKFEPSTKEGGANIEALMNQVDKVFAQHKLAVFSTHRINYVGGIDEMNRSRTLRLLDEFLTQLLMKYPDVEFLSSDKLIDVIR